MEAKHEPGPWTVSPKEPFREDEGGCVAINADEWHELAIVFLHSDGGPEGEANARLIAAAPDLLAALVELTDIEGPLPGNVEWYHRARAAIAKATGQED